MKNESNFIINDVEEAILKLPINYSIVLRLKYSQGYTNEEISKILKYLRKCTIKRISRVKERIRRVKSYRINVMDDDFL